MDCISRAGVITTVCLLFPRGLETLAGLVAAVVEGVPPPPPRNLLLPLLRTDVGVPALLLLSFVVVGLFSGTLSVLVAFSTLVS